MKNILKTVAAAFASSAMLSGCAVYEPAPVYSQAAYYQGAPVYYENSRPGPVYVQPAPVYVQPAPVYVGPPVTFGFSFGYWGGHGWGHHHH